MEPSIFSRPQSLPRLRSNSESDTPDPEALSSIDSEGVQDCHQRLSAPADITVDIGAIYNPPSLHMTSWDLESPDISEPASPDISEPASPAKPPMLSPAGTPHASPTRSTSIIMSNPNSTHRDDETTRKRDEEIQRTSDLREQLEMEKARSATLGRERDDAVLRTSVLVTELRMIMKESDETQRQLWQIRYQLGQLEKKWGGISSGEELALALAERDRADLRELESVSQRKETEKQRDEALQLASENKEALEEMAKKRNEALELASEKSKQMNQARASRRKVALRVADLQWEKSRILSQKKRMEKQKNVALRFASESLEKLEQMEERYESEKRDSGLLRWELENIEGEDKVEENKARGWYRTFVDALFD